MQTALRIVRLLAMVVWVGGLIFFAFVLAPVAFRVLASQHEAGLVVGGTLRVLHGMGFVCGGVFVVGTAVLFRGARPGVKGRYEIQILLAAVMLVATAYLQVNVLPAMERDRALAGGAVETAPLDSAAREDFDRLHRRSERVEGLVLFLGLGIVLLMARESVPTGGPEPATDAR